MSKRNIEEGESSKPKRRRSSRCNYCFRERELVNFKPYNACRKKQSRHYQRGLGTAASIVDITGDNTDDPLLTMTNAKENAKKSKTSCMNLKV